jgi:indolepyruvate ferredoxin oxidoreductase beta subunit
LKVIDAYDISKKAGAVITKNIVLLGSLAATGILPFDSKVLLDTIVDNVPAKFRSVNEKAFQGGVKAFNEE